jgi:CRP-like cAMP-binding protein
MGQYTRCDHNGHRTRRSRNDLLAALPEEDYQRLAPHLRPIAVPVGHVWVRRGDPVQHVVFPSGGVFSLIHSMENGAVMEVAGVGNEGIVGAGVILGRANSLTDVIVLVAGDGDQSLPATIFKSEYKRQGAFFRRVEQYCLAFTRQLMQTIVCTTLHSARQRCACWLLILHHRLRRGEVAITHEVLAAALGVRRPTVTLAMKRLSRSGAIRYRHGKVVVIHTSKLEEASCECYRVFTEVFRR